MGISGTQLILASASPRRAQLLQQLAPEFEVMPAAIEERRQPSESATVYVKRLAAEKAAAVARQITGPALIVGSDTLIDLNGEVMEKPRDEIHFRDMLKRLTDNTHRVRTAVSVLALSRDTVQQQQTIEVVTEVTFGAITEQQMADYWATGEPADKAAGYAIQGGAARFVKSICGSYSAVVGLPLYETSRLLQQSRQWLENVR